MSLKKTVVQVIIAMAISLLFTGFNVYFYPGAPEWALDMYSTAIYFISLILIMKIWEE